MDETKLRKAIQRILNHEGTMYGVWIGGDDYSHRSRHWRVLNVPDREVIEDYIVKAMS